MEAAVCLRMVKHLCSCSSRPRVTHVVCVASFTGHKVAPAAPLTAALLPAGKHRYQSVRWLPALRRYMKAIPAMRDSLADAADTLGSYRWDLRY